MMADPNVIFNPHSQLYFVDGDVVLTAKEPLLHEDARIQYFACALQFYASNFLSSQVCSWMRHAQEYENTPLVEMAGDEAPAVALLLMWTYFPS